MVAEFSLLGMALLILAGFLGGFINTLAGGGSMLTLPALMLLGMPADIANATNRLGVLLQSLTAIRGFKRYNRLDSAAIIPMLVPTIAGAILGSLLASYLPVYLLKPTLLFSMLAIALWMLLKPDGLAWQPHQTLALKEKPLAGVALFVTGIYGGFVQAGVGFLLLAALAGILRYDLVRANALKMVATAAFGSVALCIFIIRGQVLWAPGLILAAGMMAGAWLSVKFAIKVSQTRLKWLLFIMVSITCGGALIY